LFFSTRIAEKTDLILIKKHRPCVLSNISIVDISGDLPVAV